MEKVTQRTELKTLVDMAGAYMFNHAFTPEHAIKACEILACFSEKADTPPWPLTDVREAVYLQYGHNWQ
jgi:hypothetical protein